MAHRKNTCTKNAYQTYAANPLYQCNGFTGYYAFVSTLPSPRPTIFQETFQTVFDTQMCPRLSNCAMAACDASAARPLKHLAEHNSGVGIYGSHTARVACKCGCIATEPKNICTFCYLCASASAFCEAVGGARKLRAEFLIFFRTVAELNTVRRALYTAAQRARTRSM